MRPQKHHATPTTNLVARDAAEDGEHIVDVKASQDGVPARTMLSTPNVPTSRVKRCTHASSSDDAIALPTVAMWVLFHVLLSRMVVRFAMEDI